MCYFKKIDAKKSLASEESYAQSLQRAKDCAACYFTVTFPIMPASKWPGIRQP